MDRSHLVFLDTETTGLDPRSHVIWEIALIRGDTGEEIVFRIKPAANKMQDADSNALRLTRFYDRIEQKDWAWSIDTSYVAARVAALTAGKHLVGAVPSFDALFLDRMLRNFGAAPAWHYHLVDVEALAAAKLGLEPPWDSNDLSSRLGVSTPDEDRHTALGDARWAKLIYEAVFDKESTT